MLLEIYVYVPKIVCVSTYIEEEQMDDMLDEDEIDAQGDEVDEDTDEPATHDSLDETDE